MGKTFSASSQIGTVSTFSELVNTDFVGERTEKTPETLRALEKLEKSDRK